MQPRGKAWDLCTFEGLFWLFFTEMFHIPSGVLKRTQGFSDEQRSCCYLPFNPILSFHRFVSFSCRLWTSWMLQSVRATSPRGVSFAAAVFTSGFKQSVACLFTVPSQSHSQCRSKHSIESLSKLLFNPAFHPVRLCLQRVFQPNSNNAGRMGNSRDSQLSFPHTIPCFHATMSFRLCLAHTFHIRHLSLGRRY